VRGWIDAATPVGRERRPMRAGDVLALVRQRGLLFEAIIRALKNAGVAVAGADRLVLTEHIAIIDLLALADALLLADDDLALAVALKSPLFGFDDDMLFELAWGRRASLRAALAARAGERPEFAAADALLRRCAAVARREAPFGFFAWLLGPERGKAKIFARLGLEAADALDEFLELALEYERRETPSLQGFVAWLRGATTVVKRDMEITRDEVRVMTVHGAKGLEAPVVILADTTTPPKGVHPPRLLEVKRLKAAPEAPACIVWAGRRDEDVPALAQAREAALDEDEHEHRRLLYVAMTRAAERLIVCGYQGKIKRRPGCWYDLVRAGLDGQPGLEQVGEGEAMLWRYRRAPEPAGASPPPRPPQGEPAVERPPWLTVPAPPESGRPVPLSPSAAYDEAAAPRAPAPRRHDAAQAQAEAMARGTLIHRLLQSLPDVDPARREITAQNFLARAGAAFGADDRGRFVAQALAVFADPRFAALFTEGSRAEVPIVGRLIRASGTEILVSGQIDRLVVTGEAVLIADYKTNREPPQSLDAAPPAYVDQLALYRAVLGKIYPDRPIRAALVWTEIPDLMEIPAAMLDQAIARITSG
jgi:ATP-dependent helicase/nuclease subunit A